MTIQPPSDTPAIRLIMMPKDTNAQGSVFGGTILSLIDQAAFVEAWRQKNHRYVTVAMNAVEFHEPVHVGDILSLWAQTRRIGRTSIQVHVKVQALRRGSGSEILVTQADVTLVALDDAGRPTPVLDGTS
ncbi:MAG: acyl-CoA thioesterase [Phycisphaerae bacterium]|nr:acyl-CoA thioesterase [Phycisphaerae bacterium]